MMDSHDDSGEDSGEQKVVVVGGLGSGMRIKIPEGVRRFDMADVDTDELRVFSGTEYDDDTEIDVSSYDVHRMAIVFPELQDVADLSIAVPTDSTAMEGLRFILDAFSIAEKLRKELEKDDGKSDTGDLH